jgi:hypothetical protein
MTETLIAAPRTVTTTCAGATRTLTTYLPGATVTTTTTAIRTVTDGLTTSYWTTIVTSTASCHWLGSEQSSLRSSCSSFQACGAHQLCNSQRSWPGCCCRNSCQCRCGGCHIHCHCHPDGHQHNNDHCPGKNNNRARRQDDHIGNVSSNRSRRASDSLLLARFPS